jgi:hypothetical protein
VPTLERVDVINRALARIGETAVQFADTTAENADELVWTYESRVENALAVYPWRCTLRTLLLSQGTIPTLTNWTYAHILSSNRLGMPRRVWKSATDLSDSTLLKLYEIGLDFQERPAILSNESVIVAQDQKRPIPSLWDPPLLELIIMDLMSAYAWQVTQDAAKSGELLELAWGSTDGRVTGQFFKAKQAESVANPSRVVQLEDGPLVSARR